MLRLDVEHTFATCGGAARLIELIQLYCPTDELNYPAVQMWRQRGQIPGKWVVPVLYALHKEGHSWLEFTVDDDELDGRQ
jgi:hypothetical protein